MSLNSLSGCYWAQGELHSSREYEFEVVDRIGSGDAFAAGILATLMQDYTSEEGLEFATAAAVLKHTVAGDFCLVSKNEVTDLVNGASLRIRR